MKYALNYYLTVIAKHFSFHRKISAADMTYFFRQFATLFSSGISIIQCCDILITNQENLHVRSLVHSLKKSLEAGRDLSASMRLHSLYFNELTCYLIFAGEQSGTLGNMLNRIATQHENSERYRKKIKHSLFYPAIITFIALVITFLMFIEIIPRFAELFSQFHGQLPLLTRGVLLISAWMQTKIILCFFLFVFVLLLFYFIRKKLRPYRDKFLIRFSFFKKIYLARFTRHLAITCSAGILMTDAIQLIAKTCGNLEYEKAILRLQREIAKGKHLHASLMTSSLFSREIVQMVKIGEESGKLESMLDKIATSYETDADYFASNLANFLEPLIMCILGVLIGVLVIAMYLPIFKLGTVI